MQKSIISLAIILSFPMFVFAQTPITSSGDKTNTLQKQTKLISDYFKDIKNGVTTEKEILSWFGESCKIIDGSAENPNLKVLTYGPYSPPLADLVASSGPAFEYNYIININKTTGLVESTEKQRTDSLVAFDSNFNAVVRKPVIYLYPARQQQVSVRLEYQGDIFVSYPEYDKNLKGWDVTAYPDGRIVNSSDKAEYSYIFWEGLPSQPTQWDFSKGFIVEGEKIAPFLQDTLGKLGLTPKEYNEFIVYWYPKMKNNKYNLIHFAQAEYEKLAPLEVTPKPDSVLRIFMVYKALDKKIDIVPQEIKPFVRSGFAVVEWGGTESN
ncbi:MAG: hypothetical protein NTZ63_05340 [Candidatus Omnitrophica bacterium]|nr:hypothetical protein [Candidatus Omnitrophota bacterium]